MDDDPGAVEGRPPGTARSCLRVVDQSIGPDNAKMPLRHQRPDQLSSPEFLHEALGAYREAVELADRKEEQHLAEIALDLSHDVINRSDAREAVLAFLMMQIVRKECQQLKADYCAAYEDGE